MSNKIRAHHKSRQGCNNCKLRRVKCDETKPRCAGCSRHGTECIYLPTKRKARTNPNDSDCTTSIENNDIPSLPFAQDDFQGPDHSAKRLLDLRLMHHYCIFTTQFFASAFPERVYLSLKVDIPQLAFQHQFLMDAVFLVAMVHLGCSDPVALEDLPVYLYRDQALSGLRTAVAITSPQNLDAIRGASVLLAAVSFAADRVTGYSGLWVVNWLSLALGQRNFRHPKENAAITPGQEDNPMCWSTNDSFADISGSIAIPNGIMQALTDRQENIDTVERDLLYSAVGELGRLIIIFKHPHEQTWLEKKIKAWAFDVVPSEFLAMAREERPHALIILAHYLILFKLLPDSWVYEGLVNHDFEAISKTLGQEWDKYLTMPRMALCADNMSALIALLVESM